jgi:hypothetical protein
MMTGSGSASAAASRLPKNWNQLRLRYWAPESRPYHLQAWAAIEARVAPLAGLLRDPRGPCMYANDAAFTAAPLLPELLDLQPKDTVIVDPAHITDAARRLAAARAAGHAPKAILMDMGASNYNLAGSSLTNEWPGTRWLVERYRGMGINFTDIYAWELGAKPGMEFFEGMPIDVFATTHFYNFAVSSEPGPGNPLTVLKQVARPGDFVVFKLDIDVGTIESALVQDLLGDDEALSLISDFYYELHFRVADMHIFWRYSLVPESPDLMGATEVFRMLREKGLKAQMC